MATRESERRYGTVMFADISGFTAMSQSMDPEELTRVINLAFALLEDAVASHGGSVARYMGDSILALFGIPHALEDAPRAAVNAAIDMRQRLGRLNQEHRLQVPLDVHVGINSGLMVAGDVGGNITYEFTVMGDAVNLASRLKDASSRKSIWVGRQTYQETRFDFEYRKLRPLKLKGIEQPVVAYEVLSTTAQRERGRGHREGRLFSEIVGRDRELEEIRRCLADLAEGRGGVVSIIGEAGIGKSRLVAEAIARSGTAVLEAHALVVGESLSYHPFVDLVRQWAGIADDDGEPRALEKLGAAARELLGDDADDVIPFVATLIGLRLPGAVGERVRGIEGEALEKLIQKSVRDLFQALARRSPLVLFFEDLHWADLSSIDLLRSLLPLVETRAVLVLMAFRPGHAVSSERILEEVRARFPARHVELHLNPLDARQSALLLRNLLKIDDRPHTTRAVILSKAEGNPFFIEEVVRSLMEEGAIEETSAGLRVTEKIESVHVPATVHEVVMARVDRLPEHVRRILQLASVIGRSIPVPVLAAVAEDPRQLDWGLRYLKRAQLLDERHRGDEHEYVFRHALTREAVYESLLLRTRRDLHRAIAESIESLYAERLPEYFGMLAYHFSRAELPVKAEEYLFKAGEEAVRAAGSREALHYFSEASRLYMEMHGEGGDPHKKALLEKNFGIALLNRGDLLDSVDHFDRALRLLGERVPATPLAARWQLLADAAVLTARLSFKRISGAARTTDRETFEIRYHRARAQTTSDPKRFFFDSIGTARRLTETDPTCIDQACGMYTAVATMFGYSGLPFAIGKRFLSIAGSLIREGNLRDEFAYRSWTFVLHYLEGDWSEAHTVPEDLVEQALRYGQFWDVNTYRGLNCERLIHQGDFAGARREIDRIGELADDYGYDFARSNEYAMPALLLLQQRDLPSALGAVERYYAERHEELLNLFALGTKAKIQVYAGDPEAGTTLAQAEELRSRLELVPHYHASPLAQSRLLYDVEALEAALTAAPGAARTALARRARRSARRALRVSRAVARERVEAYRLAGRLAWLLGRPERAIQLWERGIREGERMRARPELARTYLEIGRRLGASGQGARIVGGLPAASYVEQAERCFTELALAGDLALAKAPMRHAGVRA